MAHGAEPVRAHDLLVAARPRLDRRAVEPGALVVVLPRGRRRPAAAHQLQRRHRGLRRDRRRQPPRRRSSRRRSRRPCVGAAADVVDADGQLRARRGRRAGAPAAAAGHDPRVLARPRALPGDVLVALPGTLGPRRLGVVDEDGYWFIQGRSDDTLKVAGKRVGPAEVESAAVAHPAVLEAAAVGVPHDIKGEAIVVFVRPPAGRDGRPGARAAVATTRRAELGQGARSPRSSRS